MAYTIKRPFTSPNDTQTIADGVVNTSFYSVGIQGRNAINYGQPYAQAVVDLVQNFASASAPINPIPGQTWYDFQNKALKLNTGVLDGASNAVWSRVVTASGSGNDIGSTAAPVDNIYSNHFWGGVFHGTLDGIAAQAKYADLAERYETDHPYRPGTLVMIGGEKEITETTERATTDLFGVISEWPGFMLNSKAGTDETHPYVALAGRVEVRVTGKVKKGQRLIASGIPGVAVAIDENELKEVSVLSIIGRALRDKTTEKEGLVLTVVGAK